MSHDDVDAWLRNGRPPSERVAAHLEVCAACRDRVDEAEEVRSWFPAAEPLDDATHVAMRFRLEAEARSAARFRRKRSRRRSPLLLAAALSLVGAVAFAMVGPFSTPEPREPAPERPSAPAAERTLPRRPEPLAEEATPAPEVSPPARMAARPRTVTPEPIDEAFRAAWAALGAGRPRIARRRFEALARRNDLGARRPDVLFWLAQSMLRSGDENAARRTLERLLRSHGDFHRAPDARAQLERLGRE